MSRGTKRLIPASAALPSAVPGHSHLGAREGDVASKPNRIKPAVYKVRRKTSPDQDIEGFVAGMPIEQVLEMLSGIGGATPPDPKPAPAPPPPPPPPQPDDPWVTIRQASEEIAKIRGVPKEKAYDSIRQMVRRARSPIPSKAIRGVASVRLSDVTEDMQLQAQQRPAPTHQTHHFPPNPAKSKPIEPAVAVAEDAAPRWVSKTAAAKEAGVTLETIRGWCIRKNNPLPKKFVGGREQVNLVDVLRERDIRNQASPRIPTEAPGSPRKGRKP